METIVIFRMIAGEFISIGDDEVNKWIAMARPMVNSRRFGLLYNNAIALMAAHLMKLNLPSEDADSPANAILIDTYKEGDTSIKYNVDSFTKLNPDAQLTLTKYGLQFRSIRDSVTIGITSAGE
jgi:hypothetical protein